MMDGSQADSSRWCHNVIACSELIHSLASRMVVVRTLLSRPLLVPDLLFACSKQSAAAAADFRRSASQVTQEMPYSISLVLGGCHNGSTLGAVDAPARLKPAEPVPSGSAVSAARASWHEPTDRAHLLRLSG